MSKYGNWRLETSTHVKARSAPKYACNPSIAVGRQVDHRVLLAASIGKNVGFRKRPFLRGTRQRVMEKTPNTLFWSPTVYRYAYINICMSVFPSTNPHSKKQQEIQYDPFIARRCHMVK